MTEYTKNYTKYVPAILTDGTDLPAVIFNQVKYEQQIRQSLVKGYEKVGLTYLNYMRNVLIPKKIIHNKKATIVFWKDGTKTVVKRMEGTKDDIYTAFTAALAKRLYGTNSGIKKILKDKVIER